MVEYFIKQVHKKKFGLFPQKRFEILKITESIEWDSDEGFIEKYEYETVGSFKTLKQAEYERNIFRGDN